MPSVTLRKNNLKSVETQAFHGYTRRQCPRSLLQCVVSPKIVVVVCSLEAVGHPMHCRACLWPEGLQKWTCDVGCFSSFTNLTL